MTALDEALERALRVLKFQPDSPTALASAGSLLAATGRTTEALPLLQRSVELDPRQPEVLNNLGAVLRATGRLRDARSLFEQAVALSPGYADAVLNLAGARSAEGAHEAAVADLMRLLAEGHESAALLDQLGVALWKLGRYDEALAHLRRAAELDPTFADTFSHLGVVLAEYGNLEEARDAHLRAIDLAPNRPDFYRLLAKIDPDALDARRAAALEAMGENLSRVDRIERNFALALLAVRDGDRARAFAHYSAANAETRAMRAYDERRTLDQIREVEHMFTPAFMAPRRNMGDPSDVPVFVVGMPRSGTTLVEQILASHPDVGAASFPEGSLVVKAGGVAATPDDWSVVDGAAVWRVYRPPLSEIIDHRLNGSTAPYTLQVTDLRVMQFDIIVKDTDAAPETGWVFTTFVYDKDAPRGTGPWDQLVPLGATWGNDPQFDSFPEGHPPHDPRDPGASALEQFWHNPKAPTYTEATLGWGKRMSGPIDIAKRHGIILVEQVPPGKLKADTDCDSPSIKHVDVPGEFRASGCFSCHGTSQSSAPARMYPSPVAGHLPPDGKPFCLYTPGGTEWAQWYQNRPGSQPQNPLRTQVRPAAMTEASLATLPYLRLAGTAVAPGAIAQAVNTPPRGLDYDMLLMFAIGTAQLSTQGFTLLPKRTPVH